MDAHAHIIDDAALLRGDVDRAGLRTQRFLTSTCNRTRAWTGLPRGSRRAARAPHTRRERADRRPDRGFRQVRVAHHNRGRQTATSLERDAD